MKRLLSLLALLLSAPVFAASDVTPVYPDLILQKNVTTVSTGSPQRTQPVAYQIVATGTGATVSATVKIYCKTINLHWAAGTQQGSDITLSASNTDVDTSVTVTSGCPYLYSDVTAISATTVEVVATPIYASAGASTNANAGQYADDADFTDGTSVSVLTGGVAESTATTVTDGDIGAFGMTLSRSLKTTITDSSGDSAVDATANAVRTTITSGSVSITGGNDYEDIAASQTDQALGATGAAGDRFGGFVCVLTATSAAAVTVEDGAGSAFTLVPSGSAAGVYSLTNLDWISTSGAWEFTTGANMSCKAHGDFT